ncbi:CubicO group peptidase (beta-lactamase class C family) [Novosphingobium kunmingense]|uniref:CubicO group peptidase (Beta-lactamase class C family) n=1 Tax=Novosphingobium kunmingense TaxID=1211806 RepID=A0A2N0I452_9SPHN|nr:serine hydrolase domain-containing protein [Novosphingobium kunmingense]PKB25935.1 CubicO group peptidase (beta-lactamase class C family) [Novosphingobium kunmingense]
MHDVIDQAVSRRALLRGASLLGAGAALGGLPLVARAAEDGIAAQWPAVTAMLDRYVSTRKLAGMAAAIGWGTAAPGFILRGKEGLDDPDAIGPDSLFRIYSMTKPITGMAAMILVDEGKLTLDQPISDLLPKFANMQVQVTPDGSITDLRPAKTAITVRHLLTHTAGLGYSIIQKGPIKTAYESAGLVPGQVTRLPLPELDRGRPVRSLALFADRLAEMPLVYEPGTKWSYSVGLDLMGRVIEVASGASFDAFLKERIFDPAGMTSTWFQVPASEDHRLTGNYSPMMGMLLPIDPPRSSVYLDKPAFPFGGAGLVSSPRDYDRFLDMLTGYGAIGGTRVMSEKAVRLGTSNLLPETVNTAGTMVGGAGFGAGGRVGLGALEGTYGWGGAAGTVAFVNMKAGLRAALYTQYMPSDAYPVHAEFPQAVQADLAKRRPAA